MIDASVSYNGNHMILKSKDELSGRGVSFMKMINGKFKYKVTLKAYDKIASSNNVKFNKSH